MPTKAESGVVGGRNLIISSDVTPDFYITSSGTHAATKGHFITGFIEVKANEFYTISMLLQRNGYSRVAYYDLDKSFIKRDLFRNQEVTQIKPEQDGFIRWSPDVDSKTGGYGYGYKIEKGDIATPWTPAPEDITFNLTGDNIYVGNQEVIKGYLGRNLFYNTVNLVFPEPPTDFETRGLKGAYFFGSGKIIDYSGRGVIEELNAGVIKENGLYLEEPINFHDFSGLGGSIVLDTTLERPNDIIDSLQPEESVILINSKLFRGNTIVVFVGKDSDGVVRVGAKTSTSIYSSDINNATPIGDAEYIHITYFNYGSTSGPYFSYNSTVGINGVQVISSGTTTRTGRQSFEYANISRGILLYDLKIYGLQLTPSDFNRFATTNYNGIKDLTFVRTDQL